MSLVIEAHFDITHSILDHDYLTDFLRGISVAQHGRWKPEKYGDSESARHTFRDNDPAAVVALWMKRNIGVFLKRVSKPKYQLDFWGERSKLLVKNQLYLWVEDSFLATPAGLESYLQFMNTLYELLHPAHGYAAHREDYLAKNRVISRADGNSVSSVETWVGRDLSKCLRGIYWANWFGPAYVEFFGEERFDSAPCYAKERLDDGGYLLLTAPSPSEYASVAAKNGERALVLHLGADAFYDINHPNRLTRSPWSSKFVS